MTSTAYSLYCFTIDRLREQRALAGWRPDQDRISLNLLEDLYEQLSDLEKEIADSEGWRGWPDLYDKRMERVLKLGDTQSPRMLLPLGEKDDPVLWSAADVNRVLGSQEYEIL